MSRPGPLSTIVQAFETEGVLFHTDDDRPDAVWGALCLQPAHRTPECGFDESAIVARAFVARQFQEGTASDLTEGVVQSVLDDARRRKCDA